MFYIFKCELGSDEGCDLSIPSDPVLRSSSCPSDWRLLISHLITAHHTVSLSGPLIGCWSPVLSSDWPTGIAGVKFINRETPD